MDSKRRRIQSYKQADMYQEACNRTWYHDDDWQKAMIHATLGIAGESGEIVEHIKKHLYHGKPIDCAELLLELGDLLYYVAILAAEVELPLSMVMQANVEKLEERYPNGFEKRGEA